MALGRCQGGVCIMGSVIIKSYVIRFSAMTNLNLAVRLDALNFVDVLVSEVALYAYFVLYVSSLSLPFPNHYSDGLHPRIDRWRGLHGSVPVTLLRPPVTGEYHNR